MKLGLIFGIIIGLFVFGVFGKSKKNTQNDKIEPLNKVSAKQFVNKLEKLGYYKYADKKHIDSLKIDLMENYDPNNELVSIWNDDTGIPLDYRYYWCDGETVYEQGGFTEVLEQVKPTFEKIGLKINITDHFEEWDSKNEWLSLYRGPLKLPVSPREILLLLPPILPMTILQMTSTNKLLFCFPMAKRCL